MPTPPVSPVQYLLSRLKKGRNKTQKGAFGTSRYQRAERAKAKSPTAENPVVLQD